MTSPISENAPDETSADSDTSPASGTQPGEGNSTNREAAKYRTKLREAETKLEAAETRITALLRKEIEAYASKQLAVGADLFTLGEVAVADLLDPQGNVDTETIDASVEALLVARPGLRSNTAPWGEVGGSSAAGSAERAKPTMLDALKSAKN
ncbi:hypothetical protein ACFVYR_34985 [Streptomyces sp. NPDC058284]|uniref:hypothetical protein n=1 Tax=unclassified Streptomyces TaxID=2593676 RepID=UPI00364A7302